MWFWESKKGINRGPPSHYFPSPSYYKPTTTTFICLNTFKKSILGIHLIFRDIIPLATTNSLVNSSFTSDHLPAATLLGFSYQSRLSGLYFTSSIIGSTTPSYSIAYCLLLFWSKPSLIKRLHCTFSSRTCIITANWLGDCQ